MTTAIELYNNALIEIGSDRLASISEDTERRHVLDQVYAPVVRLCLEAGQWNFSTHSAKLDADTTITPSWGYTEVFAKPSDWKRTIEISSGEDFRPPLVDFRDEGSYWLAYVTPIYVRYVSNDATYGLYLAGWTDTFARYVELSLAKRVCRRLTGSEFTNLQERDLRDAKQQALNKDALNDGQPRRGPIGSWAGVRGTGRRDRSNRSSLLG
jgi:hypothetical protein